MCIRDSLYIGYGAFVIYGFTQWVKATREESGSAPAESPAVR